MSGRASTTRSSATTSSGPPLLAELGPLDERARELGARGRLGSARRAARARARRHPARREPARAGRVAAPRRRSGPAGPHAQARHRAGRDRGGLRADALLQDRIEAERRGAPSWSSTTRPGSSTWSTSTTDADDHGRPARRRRRAAPGTTRSRAATPSCAAPGRAGRSSTRSPQRLLPERRADTERARASRRRRPALRRHRRAVPRPRRDEPRPVVSLQPGQATIMGPRPTDFQTPPPERKRVEIPRACPRTRSWSTTTATTGSSCSRSSRT